MLKSTSAKGTVERQNRPHQHHRRLHCHHPMYLFVQTTPFIPTRSLTPPPFPLCLSLSLPLSHTCALFHSPTPFSASLDSDLMKSRMCCCAWDTRSLALLTSHCLSGVGAPHPGSHAGKAPSAGAEVGLVRRGERKRGADWIGLDWIRLD